MAYFEALQRQQRHIATLTAMNTVMDDPDDWIALARAVAEAGGVQQLLRDVEARRQLAFDRRIRNELAASFRSATLPSNHGGTTNQCSGFSLCQVTQRDWGTGLAGVVNIG